MYNPPWLSGRPSVLGPASCCCPVPKPLQVPYPQQELEQAACGPGWGRSLSATGGRHRNLKDLSWKASFSLKLKLGLCISLNICRYFSPYYNDGILVLSQPGKGPCRDLSLQKIEKQNKRGNVCFSTGNFLLLLPHLILTPPNLDVVELRPGPANWAHWEGWAAEAGVAPFALLPVPLGKAECPAGGLWGDSCTGRSLLSHPSPAFI